MLPLPRQSSLYAMVVPPLNVLLVLLQLTVPQLLPLPPLLLHLNVKPKPPTHQQLQQQQLHLPLLKDSQFYL